jgi:hypothetical protein
LPEDLRGAWIVLPDEEIASRRLDHTLLVQALNKVGRKFPQDYELVSGIETRSIDGAAELYRPK